MKIAQGVYLLLSGLVLVFIGAEYAVPVWCGERPSSTGNEVKLGAILSIAGGFLALLGTFKICGL